ncbi:L-rhamnose/proton symporter RhaT [Acidobacterium sp. S8]|uniref:L-rhamnose/proton symporter RhaT n=1 Tax=Acidobacterium sp. S8 TaxID=1641854 RepID=UPI00131D16C7|nr:L-rhamnose/proton symporter RhaT [Acidobacterium sp. S8]
MGPNPFIGVIYHWIGGLASASNFIPFRPIKRWSWEIYWIIQGFAAWIVAPLLIARIFVPDVAHILRHSPSPAFFHAIFWGALWGIGGLTFGLSIRYLGIGLGYAIALGFCTAFGTLMPPLFSGQIPTIARQSGGRFILFGVFICLVAIAVNGLAGFLKEQEVPSEERAALGERDFSFGKGLAVAVFAGIMSACFAYGLNAGKPIALIARDHLLATGRADLWQNLPVLIVVLWGGFFTNFVWSLFLIIRNRSARQFFGAPGSNPMGTAITGETLVSIDPTNIAGELRLPPSALVRNYLLASLAGVIWYFQFFFYSMGQTKMGKYDFSSWTLHMASIIIFATLWGIALKEWRDTALRTRLCVTCGLFLLVFSTVIVGYGNYLMAR